MTVQWKYMKAFLFGILFLVLVGVGGFCYLSSKAQPSGSGTENVEAVKLTRVGTLVKSPSTSSDVTHTIRSDEGESWGVTSYAVNLDDYVGKKVEATGQNSGTTLYIDTITEIQ